MSKSKTNLIIQFTEDEYILNLNNMPAVTEYLDKNADIKLTKWIAKNLKSDNTILLNLKARKKITKDLKISSSTIGRSIKSLKENDFLLNDPELSATTFKVKQYAIFKKSIKSK